MAAHENSKSTQIRGVLSANPNMKNADVIATLAASKVTVTSAHVSTVRGSMKKTKKKSASGKKPAAPRKKAARRKKAAKSPGKKRAGRAAKPKGPPQARKRTNKRAAKKAPSNFGALIEAFGKELLDEFAATSYLGLAIGRGYGRNANEVVEQLAQAAKLLKDLGYDGTEESLATIGRLIKSVEKKVL